MKESISWEIFVKDYSHKNDYVHVSAIVFKGQANVDPIVLYENHEIVGRVSRKFPGAGFDKSMLNRARLSLFTDAIESELENFNFNEHQYAGVLAKYRNQDERMFSDENVFYEDEYLYFFKKNLILAFLQKTGILIEPEDKPFYIDRGDNEEVGSAYKVYRLFFGVKSITVAPKPKDNKTFDNLHKHNVKLLHASYYNSIKDVVKSKGRAKKSLAQKLTSLYWAPLSAYLSRS